MFRTIIRLMLQGIKDLSLNPWTQIFTFAAVTLVAFLAGMFLMGLCTLNHELGTVRGETAFQVYWQPGTDMSVVQEQWQKMSAIPGFISQKTYTPEQAVKELSARLGKTSKKGTKDFPFLQKATPLSPTALLSFAPPEDTSDVEAWINETTTRLKNMPTVERVTPTPLRDELGQAWRKIQTYLMWPSMMFLTLILGLIVGNTLRLALLAKSTEIDILRMVGAHNWYIRLPLVTGGAMLGFSGGLCALILLKFMHLHLYDALNFPPLLMELQFLPWQLCLLLLLAPCITGGIASWLAVRD